MQRRGFLSGTLATTLATGLVGTLAAGCVPVAAFETSHVGPILRHGSGARPEARAERRAQAREITIDIDRRLHDDALPLRRLLDLGRHASGTRIETVEIAYSRRRGQALLQLVGDGDVLARGRARRGHHVLRLAPRRPVILDDTIRRLHLTVDGRLRIAKVTLRVLELQPRRRGWYGHHDRGHDRDHDRGHGRGWDGWPRR